MHEQSSPRTHLSGAQKRKLRAERGLPRYTPHGWQKRQAYDTARTRRRRLARTDLHRFVDQLKLAQGCTDCGYNAHPAALDFDHLPGTEKRMGVARMVAALWVSKDALLAEIAKCEVVCANCHRIRTVERLQG